MEYEKIKGLIELIDKPVKIIVDDNNELKGIPFTMTETDDGEDAIQIQVTGGKDQEQYGEWPYFTEDEIVSYEEMK